MSYSQKILSIFLVGLILIQPILPYIQYFAFKDYIAKNFCIEKDIPNSCCKGKCYLEKQLAENNQTEDTSKTPVELNKENIYSYTLPVTCSWSKSLMLNNSAVAFFSNLYQFNFLQSVYHPPNSI